MYQKFLSIIKDVNSDILQSDKSNLIDNGILDSLSIMTIISSFEENFKIDFDPEDITEENFSTVDNIWKLVEKYLKEKQNG